MQIDDAFHSKQNKRHARFRLCHSILGVALAFLSMAAQAFGQSEVTEKRSRIGLALSGGGALGLAHIGVLEWFEKHHIPIDYLSGTSMGGLIGGCYCTGMTPEEIRALLESIDWNDALSIGPSYPALSLRRKEDVREVPSHLVLGLRYGVSLPEGLSSGNAIGLLLSRISLPYSEINNFDELPTPFRCMAVDLHSGEAITLKDGSLATALRATMALPALFTPVERAGKLLVDGGVLNNTPTEAIKQMGADIIIAVDLSGSFLEGKQAGSLVGILGRTIDVMTYANVRRSLKLADIILTPELAQLTGTDFVRVDAFASKGYQAAQDKARILERFALGDAEWKLYVAQRNSRKRNSIANPTFVQPEGVDASTAKALQSRLKSVVAAPLNLRRFEDELTDITAEGRFESFQYQLIHHDGTPGLRLYANRKRYGPPFLRFGLEVNGGDTDNIKTNVAARFVALDVGSPGAEARADLRLGSDKEAALEYYRPLDSHARWFVAPRLFYNDNSINLFSQGARVAIYGDRSAGAGLDLGYNTSRLSELRLGYQYDEERASVRTGSPLLPKLSGGVSAARLQWLYDGLDSPMIPSRGNRLQLAADWYFQAPGSPRSYPAAEASLSSFHPLRQGDTLFGLLQLGSTFGNPTTPLQQFTVGGPLRLGAYGVGEFRGNDYLSLTAGYLHRLVDLPPFLGGKVMVGSWYEAGGAFQRFDHSPYLSDISIGFMAETLVGPIVVGYSYGEHGRKNFYFSIGRLF